MAWGHGKHTGNLRGVEASERTLGLRSIRLLTMSPGGHIMNDVSYADTVSVMGQLGLMEGDHRPAFETPPDGTEDVIADGDRQEEENRKIADLFLTRWNQHDVAGLRDLLTEDAILHDQVYPSDQEGRDAILTQEGALFHAISNLRAKQRDAWNAGAYVIQSQEWMGTHDGDLLELGLMKTRRAFKIPVAVVQRLEEGKVAEVWRYWDLAQLLRQLDLMDAP
jgi:predicted ester cyclase